MNLGSDLFYQKLFLTESFGYQSKNGKVNWASAFLTSEIHDLSIWTGVKIITYGKLSGVPLNIFSSVFAMRPSFE